MVRPESLGRVLDERYVVRPQTTCTGVVDALAEEVDGDDRGDPRALASASQPPRPGGPASTLPVTGSQSTNTGSAPVYSTALAVATKVRVGITTTTRARRPARAAPDAGQAVPELSPTP